MYFEEVAIAASTSYTRNVIKNKIHYKALIT